MSEARSMMERTSQGGQPVLWVRSASSPVSRAVGKTALLEEQLEQAAVQVDAIHDIYRALLRLLRDDEHRPRAALVCVDDLEPEDLEFFSILARRRGMPAVYVYGHERSMANLGRAVELGATGEADVDLVVRLVSAQPPAQATPTTATAAPEAEDDEPETGAPDSAASVVAAVLPSDRHEPERVRPVEPAGAPPEPQLLEDEEATAPPRVPWRRYDNGPTRQAPMRTPPPEPSTELGPDEPDEVDDQAHQPLLTDEELRALIGEDPTPLSPNDVQDRRDRP